MCRENYIRQALNQTICTHRSIDKVHVYTCIIMYMGIYCYNWGEWSESLTGVQRWDFSCLSVMDRHDISFLYPRPFTNVYVNRCTWAQQLYLHSARRLRQGTETLEATSKPIEQVRPAQMRDVLSLPMWSQARLQQLTCYFSSRMGHSKSLNSSRSACCLCLQCDNKPTSSTGQHRDQTLRQVRIPQMDTSEVTHVPLIITGDQSSL